MLNVYAKEFIGIATYLLKKELPRKGYILVEKPLLEKLLNKNAFDTAHNKLKIWKALKWIDADKDRRVTKRVYVGEENKYKPYVKMDMAVLEVLKEVCKSS